MAQGVAAHSAATFLCLSLRNSKIRASSLAQQPRHGRHSVRNRVFYHAHLWNRRWILAFCLCFCAMPPLIMHESHAARRKSYGSCDEFRKEYTHKTIRNRMDMRCFPVDSIIFELYNNMVLRPETSTAETFGPSGEYTIIAIV